MLVKLEELLRLVPWLQDAYISKTLLLLTAAGLFLLLWGLLRLLRSRRRAIRGLRSTGVGLLLLFSCLLGMLIGGGVQGYAELLPEREILQVSFRDEGEGKAVSIRPLRRPGKLHKPVGLPEGNWRVKGSDWRLSARVFVLGGSRRYYRFHHMITRDDENQGSDEPQRAFRVLPKAKPEVWRAVHKHLPGLPWVSTYVITSDYLPIESGQAFTVALKPAGIRITGAAAEESGLP